MNVNADQLKDSGKSKSERYLELVEDFKKYPFKASQQLINPHTIFEEFGLEFNVINPWELWQNNLEAQIMFIGQDFSDTASLRKNLQNNWKKEMDETATNKVITDLFRILGKRYDIKINYNTKKTKHPLFFTNAILGIKQSKKNADNIEIEGMSIPVKEFWYKETAYYLKGLIDIVEPKYIIAMGRVAYKAVCTIYDIKPEKRIVAIESPTKLPKDKKDKILFAVQHCSGLGQSTRNLKYQYNDWLIIRSIIDPDS